MGTNLSISNLSISAFKQARSHFSANLDVSVLVAFLKSVFLALLDKSNITLMSPPKGSYDLEKIFYITSFLRDCNWTRNHNHLVHKRTLNHLGQFG